MAQGSMNQGSLPGVNSNSQHLSTNSAHPSSLSGFSFQTIGKQPGLLKRLEDATGHQNGDRRCQLSPSPSPDLEEQLFRPSEHEYDSTPGQQLPSRRNRLLEALAPDASSALDDMYVNGDDVSSSVGANPGPKEAQASSVASPLISRPQSGSTSNGQGYITPRDNLPQARPSSSESNKAKISSAKPGASIVIMKAGSGNCSSASASAALPALHPSVPPTPPPENIPQSATMNSVTQYDSLRNCLAHLQALLDTSAEIDDFTPIRELIQGAKVEFTSVSLASQKAVSLAQKCLALAQDAMSASQESVKVSHSAKMRLESAIQEMERHIETRLEEKKLQRDAFAKQLLALGESIKALEQADRRRAEQAEQEALERERARQIAVNALNQTHHRLPSLTLPSPHNGSSSQGTSSAPVSITPAESKESATMLMLTRAMEEMKGQIATLLKKQAPETHETSPQAAVHPPSQQVASSAAPSSATASQPAADPAPVHPAADPTPAHPAAASRAVAQRTEPVSDPEQIEAELRNKLHKDHKKGIKPSSATPPGSSAPSSVTQPQASHIRRDSQQSRTSSNSTPIKSEFNRGPTKVKIESRDDKVPERVVPPLPTRKPLSSASNMELEYPQMKTSVEPVALKTQPPQIVIPNRNANRSPVKAYVHNNPSSEGSSPVTLHRQGSYPGNLPIVYPEMPTPETSLDSVSNMNIRRGMPLVDVSIKTEPTEGRMPPAPAVQPAGRPPLSVAVHPPIATLSEETSPVDSPTSSISTSATSIRGPNTGKKFKGEGKGKGSQNQNQHRSSTSLSSIAPPPASAQLPPRPPPLQVPVPPVPPTMPTSRAGPATKANSIVVNGRDNSMDLAQASQQAQQAGIQVANPPRQRNNNPTRLGPLNDRGPTLNTNRSYVPPPPGPPRDRTRSPIRRSRDPLPRRGDHYSPQYGSSRRLSRSRSRSPIRPGAPLGRRSRSPIPRRVMMPYRRGSPSRDAPRSPRRRSPTPPPLSAGAGVKRPFSEDKSTASVPPPTRRRLETDNAGAGPSYQHDPPPPPLPLRGGPPTDNRWTEEWSRTADYNGSPSSGSVVSLGSQTSHVADAPAQNPEPQSDNRGPGKLALRLSDADHRNGNGAFAMNHQQNGGNDRGNGNGRDSNPPSQWNSPTMEDTPSLLNRFGNPPANTPQRNAPQSARGNRSGRGGRGGRSGGGGGAGGGGGGSALNNRISSGGAGTSGTSLLDRIGQGP